MFGFERCADCAEHERDLAALRARLASLESELARIRPVYEAARKVADGAEPGAVLFAAVDAARSPR